MRRDTIFPLAHFPSILAPDPRQNQFLDALPSIEKRLSAGGAEVRTTSMDGFPAAAVNLGWLQECIYREWCAFKGTRLELANLVDDHLPLAVQRVKEVSVTLAAHGNVAARSYADLEIAITTKDDHGWYEYDFYVRLWDDRRP